MPYLRILYSDAPWCIAKAENTLSRFCIAGQLRYAGFLKPNLIK